MDLRALGLPGNVETGHFNGMRGLDKYKDVDCLIIIGRTQAPPEQAEMRSEVLFDRVPERGPDWDGTYYPRRKVGICQLGHNGGPPLEMEYHPDPEAEAVRWSICEAELIQIIGRGRGVNRKADNPLQIDIIGTVPLPVDVSEVLDWASAQADPFKLMLARGIFPDCVRSTKGYGNVVAAILPDLFKDSQAVQDWGRALTLESANKLYPISESQRERMILAKVRLEGTRYKVPVLIEPQDQDPKEFTESILGPLGVFEIVEESTTTITDIGIPFPGDQIQGRPDQPQPPWLISTTPEPEPTPEPRSYKADDTPCGTAEEIYRQIVADMDDAEFIDADAGFAEAARLWFLALQSTPLSDQVDQNAATPY